MTTPYIAKQTDTAYGQRFSDTVYDGVLAQDTEQFFTVPGTAAKYMAVFSYSVAGEVWVALNGTAAKAVGAIATGISVLSPACREVKAGDILHFVTGLAAGVSLGVEFYAISGINGV
jgi:hypothetical protein